MYVNIPKEHLEPLSKKLDDANIKYTVTDYSFLNQPQMAYHIHFGKNDPELCKQIVAIYDTIRGDKTKPHESDEYLHET